MTTYNHLLTRVEYPRERGYRMEPSPLPSWIYITIEEEKGSKHLTVHSKIHVNKRSKVGPSYSMEFTDYEILKDLSGEIARRYLN